MRTRLYVRDLIEDINSLGRPLEIHNWKIDFQNGEIICKCSSKVSQQEEYRFTDLQDGEKYIFLVNKSDKAYAYIKNVAFSKVLEKLKVDNIVYLGDLKDMSILIEDLKKQDTKYIFCGEFSHHTLDVNSRKLSNITIHDVKWMVMSKNKTRTLVIHKESDVYEIGLSDEVFKKCKYIELTHENFIKNYKVLMS